MKTFYGVIYTIERDWLLLFFFNFGHSHDQSGLCYYFFSFFLFGCNQNQTIECICYILTSMCCCKAGRGGTCVPAQSSVFSPLAIPAFLFSSSQHPFLKFYSIQFGHISRFLSCFYLPYLSQERFASAMALQETAVYCTVRGWSLLLFAHINVTESSFS